MITSQDLERTAERLRDALRAADSVMARPSTAAAVPGSARRSPGFLARAWLVPLAAAACITAVAASSALIAGSSHAPGRAATAPPAARAQVPEFYVTLSYSGSANAREGELDLEVRRTSTGQVTASVVKQAPAVLLGLDGIAAASDRTFYFPEAVSPCQASTRLFRLTVSAMGGITTLEAVGPAVKGAVLSVAAAPDGRRIAYLSRPPLCQARPDAHDKHDTLTVLDLASGTVRTWQTPPLYLPRLSWMPDDRTLVVSVMPSYGTTQGVLGLDTYRAGGTLQTDSTVLWSRPRCAATCVTEVLAGPGDSLTAIRVSQALAWGSVQVLHIALTASGPVESVLLSTRLPNAITTHIIADSSGQHIIVDNYGTPGWLDNGKLRVLPAPRSLLGAIGW